MGTKSSQVQVLAVLLLACAVAVQELAASEVERRRLLANGLGETPPMG